VRRAEAGTERSSAKEGQGHGHVGDPDVAADSEEALAPLPPPALVQGGPRPARHCGEPPAPQRQCPAAPVEPASNDDDDDDGESHVVGERRTAGGLDGVEAAAAGVPVGLRGPPGVEGHWDGDQLGVPGVAVYLESLFPDAPVQAGERERRAPVQGRFHVS
jgi:hypothetical protein